MTEQDNGWPWSTMKISAHITQFGLVRALIGLALLYYFFMLATSELTIPVVSADRSFPTAWVLRACMLSGLAGAGFLLIGVSSRIAALICLVALNVSLLLLPVIYELHFPFLSLMLGTYAIFGKQRFVFYRPSLLIDHIEEREIWYLPLFYSVFLGFTFLGAYKLLFQGWWDGKIVDFICPTGPLGIAWPSACDWLPRKPLAYLVLFVEIGSLPLAIHPRLRPVIWLLNLVLHVGILHLLYLRRVTLVVLLMLFFLFDPNWIQQFTRPIFRK